MIRMAFFMIAVTAHPLFGFQSTTDATTDQTQMFQVVLLSASTEPLSAKGDMPKNVASALADVKSFLPYRHFQLLDVGILRTNLSGRTIIRGPKGEPCEVSFAMMVDPNDPQRILIKRFRLVSPGQDLIDTAFDIHVGETMVVGTSRIMGDPVALMVMLTAQ